MTMYLRRLTTPPALRNDRYAKLLLRGDSLTDASASVRPVTNSGVTVVDATGANLPTGISKALSFDGSSYIYCANNLDFHFGTGDFSIDLFANFASTSGGRTLVSAWQDSKRSFWFEYTSDGLYLFCSDNGTDYDVHSISWTPAVGVVCHIAISRSASILKFFVNGVQAGSDQPLTTSFYASTANLTIGATSTGANLFSGQISNLRITKGLARWTRNFTPPMRPY